LSVQRAGSNACPTGEYRNYLHLLISDETLAAQLGIDKTPVFLVILGDEVLSASTDGLPKLLNSEPVQAVLLAQ